jgi:hypothetical protein
VQVVEAEVGQFRDRAVYSDDHLYRYEFTRRWGEGLAVVWVLLDPATGDTDGKPRPTLGRCIHWSREWGYGALTIVNVFAYRATNPKDLLLAADPVGPYNHRTLARVTANAERVVAAWGAHGRLLGRGADVAAELPRALCLGHTVKGQPRHPLYVPSTASLVPLHLPPWHDDPVWLEVVWPDADTLTLLAVVNKASTRDGWVRWTWEATGVVVTGSGKERMLPDPADFTDPHKTRDWAEQQGWGYVSTDGPW